MNVETCGHVADLIVMARAIAELRDGVVARQHENGFKCGHNFAQTLYDAYNCMSSVPAFTALCLFSLNYISLTSQTDYRDLSLRLFYIENRL